MGVNTVSQVRSTWEGLVPRILDFAEQEVDNIYIKELLGDFSVDDNDVKTCKNNIYMPHTHTQR